MKVFRDEITTMYQRVIEGHPFAFSKFADGEWMAMNEIIAANGEWIMNDLSLGVEWMYDNARRQLWNSFRYQHPNYFVGVSCKCCQGDAYVKMVEASGQSQDNLTFANIFVNSNYEYFLDQFIPFLQKTDKPIILFANGSSDLSKLPFKVSTFYPIHYNAWVDLDDHNLLNYFLQTGHQNAIVLFSAGPFGNIGIHKLWKENKQNIYLDVGSTLDLWLSNDRYNKRCYAIGDPRFSKKVCQWE